MLKMVNLKMFQYFKNNKVTNMREQYIFYGSNFSQAFKTYLIS